MVRNLTFERDFKLVGDPQKPNTVTLTAEIKIYSRFRGDRGVEWFVERNSRRRALNLPEKPETD